MQRPFEINFSLCILLVFHIVFTKHREWGVCLLIVLAENNLFIIAALNILATLCIWSRIDYFPSSLDSYINNLQSTSIVCRNVPLQSFERFVPMSHRSPVISIHLGSCAIPNAYICTNLRSIFNIYASELILYGYDLRLPYLWLRPSFRLSLFLLFDCSRSICYCK